MKIEDIIKELESFASLSLQEEYDNSGLITGNQKWECTGVMVSLDVTESVLEEAKRNKCNLVIAHHPIVFKGLKKINGSNYVQQSVIYSIKNDIAVYAIHTNLDNIIQGVNGKIATQLGLVNLRVLKPKKAVLNKLVIYIPHQYKEQLLQALFAAGAGNIGQYSECSFTQSGIGSFKPGERSTPFSGEAGVRSVEDEAKVEVIFPQWRKHQVIAAMLANHPYEEVAHDLYTLQNSYQDTGSGIVGELETSISERELMVLLNRKFGTPCIKHSQFLGRNMTKIAICGGAGSFLINDAIGSNADVYITADLKYHEYFDADGKILLADIGHYESEQFTQDLLTDFLRQKFLNFAVLKTSVQTNPVHYFTP